MSEPSTSPALSLRELIAFDGAVECRQHSGAITLSLRGVERRCGPQAARSDECASVEALFAAAMLVPAAALPLPTRLNDARVFELEGAEDGERFQIRAGQLQWKLRARSVQIHRDAGRAFFRAVPPPRVGLSRRLAWTLLLLLLRLPGAAGLLARVRSGAR